MGFADGHQVDTYCVLKRKTCAIILTKEVTYLDIMVTGITLKNLLSFLLVTKGQMIKRLKWFKVIIQITVIIIKYLDFWEQ